MLDGNRDGSRGGQKKVRTTCSYCKRRFRIHPRILKWKRLHKPHWKTYCSKECNNRGLRKVDWDKPIEQLESST